MSGSSHSGLAPERGEVRRVSIGGDRGSCSLEEGGSKSSAVVVASDQLAYILAGGPVMGGAPVSSSQLGLVVVDRPQEASFLAPSCFRRALSMNLDRATVISHRMSARS